MASPRNHLTSHDGRQKTSPAARAASRKRQEARRDANACTRCGQRPPADGGTTCEPCRIARREADRAIYHARKSAGLCVRCAGPANGGGSRCAPCSALESEGRSAERKNEAARRRYRARKTAGRCTDCNAPSQGAARCEPCARRSYERSDHVRGMPLYPPSFTVVELATGRDHGTYDCEADVALCLAFAKLSRDEVEVLVDEPAVSRWAAWE